jgi:hypothetical protein
MTEIEELDNASLGELAATWRRRALQGERQARGVAHALEIELRRRMGGPITQSGDLDTRPLALRLQARPWWKFW